eukprot:GCRY01002734.1.p1 GENE.GCRY01002734.1~~GCRY01002734.1.p1  ORF type:complete len:211 (-),score=48.20 GCRY01002734.1:64-696(-)
MEYLIERALDIEGIFRIPGSARRVKEMREEIDKHGSVNFSEYECTEHDVASLFKLFFREMPDPLFTSALYDNLLDAHDLSPESERLLALRQLMHDIPEANFLLLSFLAQFLNRVSEHSSANLMTKNNLAIVFGPDIINRGADEEMCVFGMLEDARQVHAIFHSLLSYPNFFFEEGPLPAEVQEEEGGRRLSQRLSQMGDSIANITEVRTS